MVGEEGPGQNKSSKKKEKSALKRIYLVSESFFLNNNKKKESWIKEMWPLIGEGNGNWLQYSCLGNPRDGGAWWAAIYGVTQSRTRLKRLSSSSSSSPWLGFCDSSVDKASTCNAGDPGSIPGLRTSAGEGIGYPLQYSWASLVAHQVKNLPARRETWVRSQNSPSLLLSHPLTSYYFLR